MKTLQRGQRTHQSYSNNENDRNRKNRDIAMQVLENDRISQRCSTINLLNLPITITKDSERIKFTAANNLEECLLIAEEMFKSPAENRRFYYTATV